MKARHLLLLLCLTFASSAAYAQETRSTLTGVVADPTGARIPDAAITITNMETGVVTNSKSNGTGDYTVPFLLPGRYSISVSRPGFTTYSHKGLVLQTEQTLTENVTLAVGASEQVVTVEGAGALVDTATATTGQTLTAEEVEDLPSNGRSPLGFARDEYGVVSKGKHSQSQTRPFDNQAADDFSLGGGNSASNELLLNGVPNMQDSSRNAGYSPELDSVEAVRVDEFTSDASFGDTVGGVVNITTKSGTNQYHGSISEYYSGSRPLTAKPHNTPANTVVSSNHFNQFGGTIGGPLTVPHLVNGHDRMFFEYAFEGYIGSTPHTDIVSVPTQAERNGDFSALLAQGSTYQLYNPYSATSTTVGGKTTYTRAPIPGNIFSNAGLQINPVAAKYLALFPLPNYNGATTKPDGENNYFSDDPVLNNYKSNALRLDFVITPANRLYAELHRSSFFTNSSNIFHTSATGTQSQQILWGGSIDDTHTFNPTTLLTARIGFSRSVNTSEPNNFGTDPTTLGFPSYIASTSALHAIPRLTFNDNGNSNIIPSISAAPGNSAAFDSYQLFASFNKTWGHHTLKIGPDIRLNKDAVFSPGNANGTYAFNTSNSDFVTSGTCSTCGTIQPFGSTFALLALGLPSSATFDVNTKFLFNNWYSAGFIQDDWKLRPNFTISLGLRLEHETPINESKNQMTTAWSPTVQNAASAAAASNYAKAPSLLPVSQFTPTGGLFYANDANRHAYHTALAYVSPRVGFAYSPEFSHGKMSIRGGYAIFDNPFNNYYQSQAYGYSQSTSMIASYDGNQTVATTLSDPFPAANPIQQPAGAAYGINTNLGGKIVFYGPVKVAYSLRSSLDVQQQFGKNWLLEVGYINTHQVHQSYSNAVNAGSGSVPVQYLSQSPTLDKALTSTYNGTVANPYKGTMNIGPSAATSLNTSSSISQSALLWPYSEYSSVTQQLVPGASANYNALMVRLEKRMANGLDFNLNYTYSRNLGAQSALDQGGPLWYGETASDFPHSLHLYAIYQLPFGRNRLFAGHVNRLTDEFIGGWQISALWALDSGTAYSWGNVVYTGNWHDFNNQPHTYIGPVFNTSVFDRASGDQPNAYNHRTFPLYALRGDPTNNWDASIMKDFQIHDRIIVQPRVDAFNVFNRTQFSAPNLSPANTSFGQTNGQQNVNRQLQGGVHIIF